MASVILSVKQKNKIRRAVKALNDVREELQRYNPDNDINWYLEDCGSLYLMEDNPHSDDLAQTARQDRVILHSSLDNSSGGGW